MDIPNNIILTWKDNDIPEYIIEKWKLLNPEYKILFYNDSDIINFLNENYDSNYSKFFSEIPFGRYKSDFFRYCYLYKCGGCYVDIDLEPILPINEILDKNKKVSFLSVLSGYPGHIFQAILFSNPGNTIIKMCIDSMFHYGSNIGIDPPDIYPYIGHPTKCMYENLTIYLKNIRFDRGGIIPIGNEEYIVLGKELRVNNRDVNVFYNTKTFAYSRYINYDREHGFF